VEPECRIAQVRPALTVCRHATSTNKFGNLRFIAGYNNIPGQPTDVTEFSSYNNNGSSASAYAYTGTNVGNVYTVDITIPPI